MSNHQEVMQKWGYAAMRARGVRVLIKFVKGFFGRNRRTNALGRKS